MSQVLEIVSTLDSSRFHERFQTEPKPRISVAWRQLAANSELLRPICKHSFTRSKVNLERQQNAVNIQTSAWEEHFKESCLEVCSQLVIAEPQVSRARIQLI